MDDPWNYYFILFCIFKDSTFVTMGAYVLKTVIDFCRFFWRRRSTQDLIKMFQMIFKVAQELAPSWQVIITEHADIQEKWFQDAVVEKWRGGLKLVPDDWLAGDTQEVEDDESTGGKASGDGEWA